MSKSESNKFNSFEISMPCWLINHLGENIMRSFCSTASLPLTPSSLSLPPSHRHIVRCLQKKKQGGHNLVRLVRLEFLKVADTQTHVCATFSTNCAKIWILNCKNYLFYPDFTDFDSLFLCIMFFPAHFHVQIFFGRTFCLRNTDRF